MMRKNPKGIRGKNPRRRAKSLRPLANRYRMTMTSQSREMIDSLKLF